ncbi:hypothetical protein GCM10020218_070860 [Dactylosporangium vinaceum]
MWVLHMDDDTGVGADTALAMARFIEEQRAVGSAASIVGPGHPDVSAGVRAQTRLTWLADSARPAEDVGALLRLDRQRHTARGRARRTPARAASIEAGIAGTSAAQLLVEDAHSPLVFSEPTRPQRLVRRRC